MYCIVYMGNLVSSFRVKFLPGKLEGFIPEGISGGVMHAILSQFSFQFNSLN